MIIASSNGYSVGSDLVGLSLVIIGLAIIVDGLQVSTRFRQFQDRFFPAPPLWVYRCIGLGGVVGGAIVIIQGIGSAN